MSSRARALSAFHKPCFLTVVALLVMLFSSSASLFAAAVVTAAGVGLLDLWRLVTHRDRIKFSFTLAVSILLGYGLGSAIYLLGFQTIEPVRYQYWAHQGLLFDQQGLAMGLATSLLAAAMLYIRAAFERPVYSGVVLDSLAGPKAERLVWLGAAVVVLALYMGDIGYMGAVVSDTGGVSPVGAIANLMAPPLVPFTLLLIITERPLAKRLMLAAALALLVGVTFILGRRYLLYCIVLSAVALHMRGYRFTGRRLAVGVAFSVLGGLVLYWGFNFFMALRLAVWELGRDASLLELVRAALSQLGGDQGSVVQERLAENVASRPFILSYSAGLMGISSARMPAFGAEFVYSVQMAIPSILMPGKVGAMPAAPEALVHPRYGIPVFDGPNSVLVAGFDDFGFLGALVYPLFVVLLYGAFYRSLRTFVRDQPIRLFVLFTLLFQLLYIEQAFGSVFVSLRNLLIVVGVAWLLARLPVARFKRRVRYSKA